MYKRQVLGMLFYRYISENITAYINAGEWEAGNTEFDYAKLSDEEAEPVSYTHLDVYKRQALFNLNCCLPNMNGYGAGSQVCLLYFQGKPFHLSLIHI